MKTYNAAKFKIERDPDRCIQCQVCVNQCSFGANEYDAEENKIKSREEFCTGCHRCEVFCPTNALRVNYKPLDYRDNYNWRPDIIEDITKQAETGGVLLTGMGDDKAQTIYWDHILLNASQVTNPSIDPLREPMELTTYLGRKPERLELDSHGNLKTKMTPLIRLELPIMFSAMSYGAVSLNVQESLARAATEMGTLWNTGEGGLHPSLYKYANNTVVQVASGRFGVHDEYLDAARIIEIKIGQGAKPGIGGHLPGEKKVSADVSVTRMIPQGTDAISPAPQHDIYSIEDLSQLIYALKEATNYTKPISVKVAAVHNIAAIASGIVRGGADIIVIDGLRGATGAAPKVIRDNVGIPIEMALAAVDARLRQEGIRHQASIVAAGGFRTSGDIAKAIALGADAVYIGTSALISLGCHVCQQCHTGKCAWGICTTDLRLTKRVNPEIGARRAANLLRGWSTELKDILGGLGVNALESLRGNRLHLRGIGLSDSEMETLGIRMAGR
jgi:glutamate synthase domain-containing protein 2